MDELYTNKAIIKNSSIERKMSYNQIPKIIIRTFSYRKLFTRSNSINEFKNIKRKSLANKSKANVKQNAK